MVLNTSFIRQSSAGSKRVSNCDQPKRVIFIAGRGASNVKLKVNLCIERSACRG
ncbi:MAG: hypothetical protein ABI700_26375 [Chloroflexota bacterium]